MWRKLLLTIIAALGLAAVAIPAFQPAQAQSTTWTAAYYNNATLEGSPAVTRTDPNIAFNWGLGAPVAGVGADGFSVRWATDVQLSPGTYRFYALADDNVRVIFNFNQTVFDTFGTSQVGQTVSGDVVVGASGLYHIQVDYREVSDNAYAFVSYANLATNPTGPSFVPPANQSVGGGSWTSQYFNNSTLAGSPVAILSEASPSHNWGNGSPLPSVPADYFSVRFTSAQSLPAGNYQAQFLVDDGVRFFVNGALLLDAFGAATGQQLVANFSLSGGQASFQIDYVEYAGDAFLTYNLVNQSAPIPQPQPTTVPQPQPQPPSPTGAVGTITAFRLNVRQDPNPTALVLTRVSRGDQYPVVARSADGGWFRVNVGSVTGWVSAVYLSVTNEASVPIGSGGQPPVQPPAPQPPAQTGATLTVTPYVVRLRSGPGTQFDTLARIAANTTVPVVGRTSTNQWYQVNFNGIIGWVTSQYSQLSPGTNAGNLPVTG